MKKADIFFKKEAALLRELVASVKEICHAITQLTGQDGIQLSEYEMNGVTDYDSGFAYIYMDDKSVSVRYNSPEFCDSNIYDLGVTAVLHLYAELEDIYKYEKKHCQTA